MTDLRAITLWQPWASLVPAGLKTIETRGWATRYRGRLLIHAAQRRPIEGAEVCGDSGWYWEWDLDHGVITNWRTHQHHPAPLGAVVCTANLVDVVPMYSEGQLTRRPKLRHRGEREPFIAVQTNGANGDRPPALTWFTWMNTVSPNFYIDKDKTEQLLYPNRPYGDFAPGRYGWLLEDIKPVEERCPACWGRGYHDEGPHSRPCPVCDRVGACAPISMKGKQGLWTPRWPTPEPKEGT